jgi:HAD superfamily hydrolase (TIGR01509 family)
MNAPLVIFDCDGVLVDSEPISIGLLVEHCRASKLEITEAQAYEAFLGKPLADASESAKSLFGRDIAPVDLLDFQIKILEAFRRSLEPVSGVSDALSALDMAKCVASSSNMSRIRMSLTLTGLDDHFREHFFSTDLVQRGKPHPDVFLHAVHQMNAIPECTVVVEDSPAGIRAAKAAGMRVIGFCGASHSEPAKLKDRLAVLQPDLLIDDMSHLKPSIEKLLAPVA